MIDLVKLTRLNDEPVYVNTSTISYITQVGYPGSCTRVQFIGDRGSSIDVKETPDEVLDIVNKKAENGGHYIRIPIGKNFNFDMNSLIIPNECLTESYDGRQKD